MIAQKAGELTAPVREKLREKVPEKFSDGAQAAAEKSTELLEKAFEKSFEVVLEKGSRWIGKLCSEEKAAGRLSAICAEAAVRLGAV